MQMNLRPWGFPDPKIWMLMKSYHCKELRLFVPTHLLSWLHCYFQSWIFLLLIKCWRADSTEPQTKSTQPSNLLLVKAKRGMVFSYNIFLVYNSFHLRIVSLEVHYVSSVIFNTSAFCKPLSCLSLNPWYYLLASSTSTDVEMYRIIKYAGPSCRPLFSLLSPYFILLHWRRFEKMCVAQFLW